MLTSCSKITTIHTSDAVTNPSVGGRSLFGTGADGELLVLAPTQINDVSAFVTSPTLSSGAQAFEVESSTGFSNGDEVLIVQMQDTTGQPLNREFAQVKLVGPGKINLSAPLTHSYTSGARYSTRVAVTQVIRVPQFQSVFVANELTAPPWNSQTGTGGILVFRVNGLLILGGSGLINMDGAGFSGSGNNQGESVLGLGGSNAANNGSAGGNGTAGGAGSHGTLGIAISHPGCQYFGSSGVTFGNRELTSFSLGAAGGGTPRGSGGSGGGGIIIYAASLKSSAQTAFSVQGTASTDNPQCYPGGGAGGSVFISIADPSFSGIVRLSGGQLGDQGYQSTTAGGSGRLRVDYSKASSITPDFSTDTGIPVFYSTY